MGELYEPYPKLPKNIRQIGERDQVLKLYLEDYVNSYLKRLRPSGGSDLRVGLLLGNVEMHEDTPYVFVDGALEMEHVTEEGEKVVFTEEAWKKAYQDVEQMFPKRTVQGWFLCGSPGCNLSPLNYWRQHGQYFTGKHQLMYLNSGLEGEEAIYITSSDGFYKLRGHSIFYERNQMMQDYMVLRREARRVETGVDDKVIRDFRKRMDERKAEATHHKSTVGLLTGLCSVLTITVFAGGVAMFNNYQKMQRMESVIASVVPGGSVLTGSGKVVESPSGKGFVDANGPDYVIEEAHGQVYPTTAPADESADAAAQTQVPMGAGRDEAAQPGKEQPSPVKVETMAPGQTDGAGQAAAGSGSADVENTQGNGNALSGSGAQSQGAQESAAQGSGHSGGTEKSPQNGNSQGGNSQGGAGATGQSAGGQAAGGSAGGQNSSAPSGQESGGKEGSSQAPAAAPADYKVYTVEAGDTLYGICFKLYSGIGRLDDIMRVNGLENQDSIYAGQKLLVP
ncbi:MAG: LysM peptidoglycan-binding domain-containing protein [Enterocloster asparagiformis]|nr:LysM peptidoglycan-binding domain-containing protein [Enterocloster asparagiformis]